jgi:hypothetical protein
VSILCFELFVKVFCFERQKREKKKKKKKNNSDDFVYCLAKMGIYYTNIE